VFLRGCPTLERIEHDRFLLAAIKLESAAAACNGEVARALRSPNRHGTSFVTPGDSFSPGCVATGALMRFQTIFLAGLFAAAAAQPALAGDGFYIGAGLGIESPSNSVWHVPSLSQFGRYSLKNSNSFLADAGYKFSNGFRVELEGQENSFHGDKITISNFAVSSALNGHISEATVYLNGNYDFPLFFHGLSGTIGAGVGSAWNDAHGSAFNGFAIVHGSDRAFAWQVGAGIIHRILPNLDLQVDYRYQGIGSTNATETGVGTFELGNIKSQTVTLSARFYILP
jgi:opacity protein-like surface antigen